MAPKKKSAKKSDYGSIKVQRGGESFSLEKMANLFAVKKRRTGVRAGLALAATSPDAFPGLNLMAGASTGDVEVYRVDAASLDNAMSALRERGTDVEWCAHVYHMEGDSDGAMVPGDSIYVETVANVTPKTINQLLAKHHLELIDADDGRDDTLIMRLTSASTENPIKIAAALARSRSIKLAEPDFSVQGKLAIHRPTDDLFDKQWHLENRGGSGLTAGADVAATAAWDITRGSRDVTVAVIDDGVQTSHPDFSSPGKVVKPFDFGQQDPDPSPVFGNDNHGTACAGVAVADENGSGVVGSAPGCELMPLRMSTSISDATIKAMFDYVRTEDADVVSCSWGVTASFFTLSTSQKRSISRAATEGRGGRGCVILFAAGNENSPVDGTKGGQPVRSGFAIHPDVIAISASNSHDKRSHYSNFGEQIWVCAPSNGSGGRGIVTTDRTGGAGYQQGSYTTVETFGGTSSATPLAAGVCGLMLSVNPQLSAVEVKEILRDTAVKIDSAGGDYDASGHSELYGFGRVDAFEAVKAAQGRLPPVGTRQLSLDRSPALAIPDRQPVGVSDVIRVADNAVVRGVGVDVEIAHTYRGDLRVELIAPNGDAVMLHNRSGRGGDNLVAGYDAVTTPGLAGLAGQRAAGDWVLRVSDHAAQDVGTLDRWVLHLALDGAANDTWETAPGGIIPDNDTQGISSELAVDGSGALTHIELTVDINHSWRGDLQVTLESPSGVSARVHDFSGRDADNLKRSYSPADTPTLQALVDAGIEINGVWRLLVADRAPQDIGKLNAWKLVMR